MKIVHVHEKSYYVRTSVHLTLENKRRPVYIRGKNIVSRKLTFSLAFDF